MLTKDEKKTQNKIIQGDCIEEMKQMPEESIDSIVTDPPYGLAFMSKSWDDFEPKEFQEFSEKWGKQALRVLKPGGYLLAFCGTRTYHRMVTGLEDAGFEIKDQIDWITGQGFPKSHDISKGIDKYFFNEWLNDNPEVKEKYKKQLQEAENSKEKREVKKKYKKKGGFEREVVETTNSGAHNNGSGINPGDERTDAGKGVFGKDKEIIKKTKPATLQAKKWDGWGTTMKPAFEPIVCARKPLNTMPSYMYLIECRLKSLVKIAEKVSKLSLPEQKEELNSVLKSVEQKNNILGDSREVMDILQSEPKKASIGLNMILLWKNIWAEISRKMKKSITKTGKEMTTDLKTLNWLIGQITYQDIIQRERFQANGKKFNAPIVEKLLKKENLNLKDIKNTIVQEIATSKKSEIGLYVKNAEKNLHQTIQVVSFALLNVLIGITTERERKELLVFANNVEKNLRRFLQDQKNIVEKSVCQKPTEKIDFEPKNQSIVLAQKPREGTYAENMLKYGVGGLNIDDCRIETDENLGRSVGGFAAKSNIFHNDEKYKISTEDKKGRWPANVLLDPQAAQMLDRQSGLDRGAKAPVKGTEPSQFKNGEIYGDYSMIQKGQERYDKEGGASRFFYSAKAHKSERNAMSGENYELKEDTPEEIKEKIREELNR